MKTLKAMIEKRNAALEKMQEMANKVKEATRAFSDDEQRQYDELKSEVENFDKTIKALEEARDLSVKAPAKKEETQEQAEIRAFADYIRTGKISEIRANESVTPTPQNFTLGKNGAIVPTTIANRIITKIKDICPIFEMSTIYYVKGTLQIPVYGPTKGEDNKEHAIGMKYAKEFEEMTADAGAFTSIDLNGYLASAVTLVSKSLINSSDINLVDFVVNDIAKQAVYFVEHEMVAGAGGNACTGAINTSNTLTAASSSAITMDDLIKLKIKIRQAYQKDCCWIMNNDTFGSVCLLKDTNGRPLLNTDPRGDFEYTLLGKPVHLSDSMPGISAGARPLLYGDFSGMAVNIHEAPSVQILLEKYATMHAIAALTSLEMDCDVAESDKIAALVMAASA